MFGIFHHKVFFTLPHISLPFGALPLLPLQMLEAGADVLLVTMLDEVAWLLNLRGSDVQCNPVFLSYVIVPLKVGSVKPGLLLGF